MNLKGEKEKISIKKESPKKSRVTMHKIAKQVKGITLIALVVTIIVLLILAGIAINLTIGDNGIFKRAGTAVNTWRNAETNEQLAMGELEGWIDETINGPQAKEGTLAWMYEQAEKDNCPGGTECTDPENHLHIGDYVKFENKVNEYLETQESQAINVEVATSDTGMNIAQHYTVSTSENQVKWRVLGYDRTAKEVKLKAELPLETNDEGLNGMLYLYGAEAYLKAPNRLDSICEEIYGKVDKVTNARSMKIEDVSEVYEITDISSKDVMPIMNNSSYEYGDSLSDITGVTPEDLMDYMEENNINNSYEYDQKGYTTQEEFVNEYRKQLTNEKVTGYAYIVKTDEISLPGELEAGLGDKIVETNSTKYDLLFKNATAGTSGAYWLSSPGVYEGVGNAYFGLGAVFVSDGMSIAGSGDDTFASNGGVDGYGFGLCPVVSLESEVRPEDFE